MGRRDLATLQLDLDVPRQNHTILATKYCCWCKNAGAPSLTVGEQVNQVCLDGRASRMQGYFDVNKYGDSPTS